MKRILFAIYAIMYFGNIFSQNTVNFQLQSDGTFLNTDGKNYAVLNFSGKAKDKLYSDLLVSATKLYNSPKDVISKVENEVISVNGISKYCIHFKGWMGVRCVFSIQYVLQFQFKDEKIRVDAPTITRFFTSDAPNIEPFSGWLNVQNVFKKEKPNPKKQNTIDDFNNTLNELINSIISNMEESSSKSNW